MCSYFIVKVYLISPQNRFSTIHNDVPFRMPYPDNEYQYNKENVEAATVDVVDNTWGKQMWWDTRTGVH